MTLSSIRFLKVCQMRKNGNTFSNVLMFCGNKNLLFSCASVTVEKMCYIMSPLVPYLAERIVREHSFKSGLSRTITEPDVTVCSRSTVLLVYSLLSCEYSFNITVASVAFAIFIFLFC
jgi:hypothetical protein